MHQFSYVTGLPELKSLDTMNRDDSRYYIIPDGQQFPSVTTVLGHFKKKSIMEWRNRVGHEEANRISNRASVRGTKFHNLMERYLKNELDDAYLRESIMPDMRQAFNDMKSTLDRINNIHFIECTLYSTQLKIAGRTDVIGEFDNELAVIDFKTSLREKKEDHIHDYFLQATAYSLMYEERLGIPINKIVVLISTDGLKEPQVWIKNKNDYSEPLMNKVRQYYNFMETEQ
jgi:ATP-dependent exoDNAse (exonuclease V) beta subunit